MSQNQRRCVHLITILNYLSPKMLYGVFIKEIMYLRKVKKTLKQIGWTDIEIKSRGFAANGSFLYLLLKILIEKCPENILELGSGETTKLIYRYVSKNENTHALILENSKEWFNELNNHFNIKNFDYIQSDLTELTVSGRKCMWYSYDFFKNEVGNDFNLILIDGPLGTCRYSRLGVAKFLPKIINKNNFFIIFDDSMRKGEQDTIKIIKDLFTKKEIEYISFEIFGSKKQTCFSSKNFSKFLNKEKIDFT